LSAFRPATPEQARDVNRSAVFRMIVSAGPIARTSIAKRLGLSPATVTSVTRELIEQGLIRVARSAPSRRGRPALLLEIVGGAATAFGVKIAPDHLVGVRVNLDADVVERFEAPFDPSSPSALDELSRTLQGWMEQMAPGPPLLGIGLGVGGVFDSRTGLLDSPLIGWRAVPLGQVVEERLGLPVVVDNDVNTLAVAERLYGRGHDAENFLTVTIGRGVGLGIVIGGDIYRGFRGGAGEFGHTRVEEAGALCSCGKRGCLETVVGDPALVASARAAGVLGPRQGLRKLHELAAGGDGGAQQVYGRAGAALGRAVGDLVNLFAPELVLVSGEGVQAWEHLAEAFHEAYRANVFAPLGDVQVEVDPWDDAKWAVGAATLVLRASLAASRETESGEAVRARLESVAAGVEVVA
jgi:predicted NBD/HSP70 family sugar kinase